MTALITAEHLHFVAASKVILDDVSVALHQDEILTIIGPNGAGKTSLLRILIGLQKPSSGRLQRKKGLRFGYMPQKLQLNPTMPLTVARFLKNSASDAAFLQSILSDLNITHLYQQSMHQLSGGERQRVLLARAMLRRPDVLALDEPAQGVDVVGQSRLYELIERVRKRHRCAVLMVSHDLHLVMAKTDRVICLNQHICCEGHPDSVANHQAYLALLGDDEAPAVATYVHHHDHHHNLQGDVVAGTTHHQGCQHDC